MVAIEMNISIHVSYHVSHVHLYSSISNGRGLYRCILGYLNIVRIHGLDSRTRLDICVEYNLVLRSQYFKPKPS